MASAPSIRTRRSASSKTATRISRRRKTFRSRRFRQQGARAPSKDHRPTPAPPSAGAGLRSLRGMPLSGTFYSRSGATAVLREGRHRRLPGEEPSYRACSGSPASSRPAALEARRQLRQGERQRRGGTALGLLPFLGAGKTHRSSKDNPYDKPIDKAIKYLISIGTRRPVRSNHDMYAHGICTIAICKRSVSARTMPSKPLRGRSTSSSRCPFPRGAGSINRANRATPPSPAGRSPGPSSRA